MTLRDSDLLNLPSAADFLSEPPRYTASEMIELCEALLPYWNQQRYAKPEPPFVGEAFKLHSQDAAADSDDASGDTRVHEHRGRADRAHPQRGEPGP